MKVILLIGILATLLVIAYGGRPVEILKSKDVRKAVCHIGVGELEKYLEGRKIPSFKIKKVKVHSIRIGEVDIDDCSVKHVKGGRYSIKLGDIDIVVKGKYKKSIFKGKWKITIRRASIKADVNIKTNRYGVPTKIYLIEKSCDVKLPKLKIKFSGSVSSFVLNLFKKRIGKKIKGKLDDEICDRLKPFYKKNLLRYLKKVVN